MPSPLAPSLAVLLRELRSLLAISIAVLSTGLLAVGAAVAIGDPVQRGATADADPVRVAVGMGSFALGSAIAWRQVEEEQRADTWTGYWLLPVARRTLGLMKLGAGMLSIAVAAGLPVLGLVLWTA